MTVLADYLNLNFAIVFAVVGLALFRQAVRAAGLTIPAPLELRLHYGVALAVLAFSTVQPVLPKRAFFDAPAKIWASPSLRASVETFATNGGGYLGIGRASANSLPSVDLVSLVFLAALATAALLGTSILIRDLRALQKLRRTSFLIRQIGRVRVYVSDSVASPFSFWLPGRANIVLPSAILSRETDRRIALIHELQHHRAGDTRWVYVFWALRTLCAANPFVHLWSRTISEIQEFACDETLVDRKKVESQAYARCLVEAASTAIERGGVPVCATGLAFSFERKLLKRRIEKMLKPKEKQIGAVLGAGFGFVLAVAIGSVAFASRGLVQDRRVSAQQAQAMAVHARAESDFPVVVNDLVLKQLNRFLGTPEGRDYMKASLARMTAYKPAIEESLRIYGAPVELLAVPVVESGYQNLAETGGRVKSAGLWQFIRSSARDFGLRVDDKRDERLDVASETDAALRYLAANRLRFKDWPLAILAYNMGERGVQKGIEAIDSRDAWTLIRHGYEGDKDYLAKVMAAILIMRNPDALD